jgi:hypothetical protein
MLIEYLLVERTASRDETIRQTEIPRRLVTLALLVHRGLLSDRAHAAPNGGTGYAPFAGHPKSARQQV